MRTLKIKKLSLAVCLAFLPLSLNAAGLGKLTVTSNLGEPFKGEIELIATTPEEMETLVAVIASEEAYAAQGITRLGIHHDIKVELVDAKGSQPKLKLSSNQAVTDPYIDMLIQLDWAAGRLQREYTVLLDPPGYKQAIKNEEIVDIKAPDSVASATETPASSEAEKSTNTQNAASQTGEASDVDEEIKALQEKAKPARTKPTQRKTKSGDNLSKIASAMRVDGVSLDQMLAALYEHNKDAFVGENMNRLKVGKVIKVPSKEAILASTRSEASKTVQLHVSDWQAYRTGIASAVPTTKTSEPTPAPSQADSGKVVAAEKPAAKTDDKTAQDVVKLSAGEKGKAEKDPKKAEEAKKVAEQEDKVAHDKALAEAQDRTTAVEKQIDDMQKLLAMKNKAMTDLQKKAEADLAAQKQAETAKPEAAKPEEAKPAEPTTVTPTPETPATSEPVQEPAKVEPPKEEVKPAPVKPPVAKAPEPVVEEPSFISSILESINLPLLAGVGGIGLLVAGWMFLRNKRRKDLESFERGILTSGGLKANTVFGNTTGSTSATDTSFLTDFAQSTDGTMMDTNDVDPIAEAEVYMAYGRDAQAEEILKDAITKEPKRYELHLKLLEMYAGRKDTSAFETIAGELYTTLGSDDPTWEKVVALGKELEPDNPLYATKSIAKEEDVPVATEKVVAAVVVPAVAASVAENLDDDALPESSSTLSFAQMPVEDEMVEEAVAQPTFDAPAIEVAPEPEEDVLQMEDEPLSTFESALNTMKTEVAADLSAAKEVMLESAPKAQETFTLATEDFDSPEMEDLVLDTDLSLTSDQGFEVSQSDMTVEDLNFDLSDDAPTETPAADSNLKAFDLSSISLDLNGPTTELTLEAPEDEPVSASGANAADGGNDVDVKLNLVAAYIDMDDKEGARELLEEVLKEGNEEQVVKAQMMLDNMG